MQVNEEKAKLLSEAIAEWRSKELITEEQSQLLKQTYTIRKFDWKQVTIYAFIIAVICGVLSVIILLADKPLRALIEKFTQITDAGISSILTISTVLAFWYAKRRFRLHPATPFSNQSFLLVGAFLSIASISYWAKTLHIFQHEHSLVFIASAVLYLVLAVYFRSRVLWVLGILVAAFAYGVFSAFYDSDTMKFLGMNFALRFIPFSLAVLVLFPLMDKVNRIREFSRVHLITGFLLFYTSLWLLTVFGNYNSYERWNEVKQVEFMGWDILLFTVSAAGMYFGLRRNNLVLGNISLIFFIINLLTRYFEYFWVPLHKSVFFMILAVIFWFIGSRAERWWNLKFLEEK